jgi:hypothetical protein
MSKKSRRRNKRLLMLAALAGGAAMMGRGKKKFGTDAGFLKSGAAGGASLSSPPIGGTDHIIKKAPVDKVVKTDVPRHIVNRSRNKVFYSDGTVETPGTLYQKSKLSAGNKIPPSMRGGLPHAEGYQKRVVTGVDNTGVGRPTKTWGYTGGYSMQAKGGRIGAKKGGSVTGIAKRGFGRALKKK